MRRNLPGRLGLVGQLTSYPIRRPASLYHATESDPPIGLQRQRSYSAHFNMTVPSGWSPKHPVFREGCSNHHRVGQGCVTAWTGMPTGPGWAIDPVQRGSRQSPALIRPVGGRLRFFFLPYGLSPFQRAYRTRTGPLKRAGWEETERRGMIAWPQAGHKQAGLSALKTAEMVCFRLAFTTTGSAARSATASVTHPSAKPPSHRSWQSDPQRLYWLFSGFGNRYRPAKRRSRTETERAIGSRQ